MPKPRNHEEANLPDKRRMELFLSDVWHAVDAHGIDHLHAAYILNALVQDLLWERIQGEQT